jgi:SAM-dependent methyltransferase
MSMQSNQMKNRAAWKPTRVLRQGAGFGVSGDPNAVAIASRLVFTLALRYYEKAIRQHARGRLLDLGCGYVPYLEIYSGLVEENVCLDWENSFHKSPFLDLTADLNNPIPLPDESFDTVLVTDVLEHISEPQRLVREIGRLLRNNGKAIIGVPFLYWLHEEPFDYQRYSGYGLKHLCEQAGLQIVSLETYGGAPEVLMDILGKTLTFLPGFSALLRPYCWLCLLVERSQLISRVSKATAPALPLGYCVVAQKFTSTAHNSAPPG